MGATKIEWAERGVSALAGAANLTNGDRAVNYLSVCSGIEAAAGSVSGLRLWM